MKNLLLPFVALVWLVSANSLEGQNVAQLLGYPPDAKLLIIHADDLGVAHSVNSATIKAYENGGINSSSIMVPCPWFEEIAKYFREHPQYDYGLHLTLTNEWKYYNWDGVSAKNEIPSLLNDREYFYDNSADVARHASLEEVEKELRAQIDKALAAGLNPSHLDSHMGSLFQTPELMTVLLKLGEEYGIPVLHNASLIPEGHSKPKVDYGLSTIFGIAPETPPDQWRQAYDQYIRGLEPGLHEMIVHLAYEDAEMKAMTAEFESWGADWRQRDLDYVLNDDLKQLITSQGVILVTWRQIQELIK